MGRIEKIKELLNTLSSSTLIKVWNKHCDCEDNMDDYIYDNDDDFFETFFENAAAAVRAVYYGDYYYTHNYVVYSDNGYLYSFDYSDDENSPIDIDALAEWIDDNDGCDEISDEDGYDEIFNDDEED